MTDQYQRLWKMLQADERRVAKSLKTLHAI